jgi:two-component system cell cycle response regulator
VTSTVTAGEEGTAVPAPRPDGALDGAIDGAAGLAGHLTELEILSRFGADGLEGRVELAAAAAADLGRPELELRARLVGGDLLRRRGDVAAAGRIAQAVHRWATDHGVRSLVARSSFVLAAVFQELGDLSEALEHAVRSVDLLDDDCAAAIRIDHLARLADCLGLDGDDAAQERYDHVLRLAEELGDVDRQLVILNNRAYCATVTGRFDLALTYSARLRTLSEAHGVPVPVGRLDTVARALMGLGRLEQAEAVLLPGLDPERLDASGDGDAGADFLLTLAEVRRRLGRRADAQAVLDECVRRCEAHGLTAIRVRARREQAELHAAGRDYRAAYEEQVRYCEELQDLQSAQRDARARAVHAMYETTEARKQSRRWRELSLRDPLTGLYNRRYVDEQLARVLRGPESVAVALLDLDHFKQVNDTCSHEVGDEVLRTVAGLLQDGGLPVSAGPDSFAARLGGEEFMLVLVGVDAWTADRHLESVRATVAAHPWAPLTGRLPVTVSIGATSTAALADATAAELLARADGYLYRAKRSGRDRVVSDLVGPLS